MANIKKIEGKTGTAYKITVTTGRDMDEADPPLQDLETRSRYD